MTQDSLKNGERLLLKGQELREQGKTFEALDSINRALGAFAAEHDQARFAHAILDRAICWQHLHQFSGSPAAAAGFAVLYRKDAEAMLELALASNATVEIHQAYFINGKASSMSGDYNRAIECFTEAIAQMPEDRNAQRGDWRINLGKALYLVGKKEQGMQELLAGIAQVKAFVGEVDSYTANVWISGGYLRLAEVLQKDDSAASAGYLAEAQKIVDSDPMQVVRKKQVENFMKTDTTGL